MQDQTNLSLIHTAIADAKERVYSRLQRKARPVNDAINRFTNYITGNEPIDKETFAQLVEHIQVANGVLAAELGI